MYSPVFTSSEREKISVYFGKPLQDIDLEFFNKTKSALRNKYHPDKFEKYEDDTIREIMNEKFKEVEGLFKKNGNLFLYFEARKK